PGSFQRDHVRPVPIGARRRTGWELCSKGLPGIIPSAVLIFVVLGTMMLGLATPTEAGAMGAVGAIVLAAMHHKDFSTTGSKLIYVGVIAAGIGTMVGIFMSEGIIFKLAFVVTYF